MSAFFGLFLPQFQLGDPKAALRHIKETHGGFDLDSLLVERGWSEYESMRAINYIRTQVSTPLHCPDKRVFFVFTPPGKKLLWRLYFKRWSFPLKQPPNAGGVPRMNGSRAITVLSRGCVVLISVVLASCKAP